MEVSVPNELPAGAFEGQVTDVEVLEFENTKYGEGTRQVAAITFSVESEDGDPYIIKYYPTLNWSPSSKWKKLLRALGVQPTPGTTLELDDLVGRGAIVVVDSVTEGEETRVKITDVLSLDQYTVDEQG